MHKEDFNIIFILSSAVIGLFILGFAIDDYPPCSDYSRKGEVIIHKTGVSAIIECECSSGYKVKYFNGEKFTWNKNDIEEKN